MEVFGHLVLPEHVEKKRLKAAMVVRSPHFFITMFLGQFVLRPLDRYQGNDFPVLRLADVMLMKAEAILRGAAPTVINGEMQTADVLVTKIRTRAKTTAATGVTLNDLLEERAREMAWEGWRRNDLIRFGKFEDKWGFKDNDESYRRLYPIPNNEIVLSGGNLTQNTGYIK